MKEKQIELQKTTNMASKRKILIYIYIKLLLVEYLLDTCLSSATEDKNSKDKYGWVNKCC